MSFASLVFFIFLPVVFCVYWLVPHRKWQNSVLLLASYFFYAWWDWRFCFLMIGSSLLDYWAGILLADQSDQRRRKTILTLALSANLLILGFFKYYNFFADSFGSLLEITGIQVSNWTLKIILPVGISFYTFQTMSYTLDIYFRRFQPMRSVVDYLTFVSFFPQLVAGPIERATNLLPQFYRARSFSLGDAREGCRFILWGLAKKLIVADSLAPLVTDAFSSPEKATGAALFLGTICFAFQIYCDFSGYSDMAVGTAKLFGIQLMRNFAYPYFSQSITEFWRRWHISLSTWFRDYIYIPLGGNRVSRAKQYRNLFVVALISGLWHGAAWHFVIWGVLHGLFLVGERALGLVDEQSRSIETPSRGLMLAKPIRVLTTFSLACFAWIFFRAETAGQACTVVAKIAGSLPQPAFYSELLLLADSSVGVPILGAFILIEWLNKNSWNTMALAGKPALVRWSAYTVLFWFILLFGTEQTQTFIYFAF